MDYHQTTHCPNCFKPSLVAICPHCAFNRDDYLKNKAGNHYLPLFTRLDKGYAIGRVLGEGGFAIVYAALREVDGLAFAVKEYYPESLASRGLNNCTVQAKRNETERLAVWQKRVKEEAEHLRRCQDYPAIAGVVKRADLLEPVARSP
jgi:serine/threonine protein kinase